MEANETSTTDKPKPNVTPLEAVLELARRGRREVLPQLRKALDEHPEIWKHHGDLAGATEEAWLETIAQKDLLVRESIRRQLAVFKSELQGSQSSPLELAIIDRLAIAWLAAAFADVKAAGEGGSPKMQDFLDKRAASADRRFHHAAKTLALVRRLLIRPVLVINEPGKASGHRDARGAVGGRMAEMQEADAIAN